MNRLFNLNKSSFFKNLHYTDNYFKIKDFKTNTIINFSYKRFSSNYEDDENDFDYDTIDIKNALVLLDLNTKVRPSLSDIKKKYTKLVVNVHPDYNDSPNANEEFYKLKSSYEILIDQYKKDFPLYQFISSPSSPNKGKISAKKGAKINLNMKATKQTNTDIKNESKETNESKESKESKEEKEKREKIYEQARSEASQTFKNIRKTYDKNYFKHLFSNKHNNTTYSQSKPNTSDTSKTQDNNIKVTDIKATIKEKAVSFLSLIKDLLIQFKNSTYILISGFIQKHYIKTQDNITKFVSTVNFYYLQFTMKKFDDKEKKEAIKQFTKDSYENDVFKYLKTKEYINTYNFDVVDVFYEDKDYFDREEIIINEEIRRSIREKKDLQRYL